MLDGPDAKRVLSRVRSVSRVVDEEVDVNLQLLPDFFKQLETSPAAIRKTVDFRSSVER